MKKNGFTLAEVLITLGIIGVVAALTAPALVKNSGQAKIGPALAKFVNTFETGCEQMMRGLTNCLA
jgi:prepilin-type N-terminal cleavage/methylation domain-containing protein